MPPEDPRAAHRAALLDQLRYLVVEAEALGPLLAGMPEAILHGRPAGEPSVLEAFARLAALDRHVHAPRLARLAASDAASGGSPPPAGEGDPIPHATPEEALGAVREARGALVAAFEALPVEGWARPVSLEDGAEGDAYDLALAITRHDVETLRTLAYRMNGAAPQR
jgi:hypothetical protein